MTLVYIGAALVALVLASLASALIVRSYRGFGDLAHEDPEPRPSCDPDLLCEDVARGPGLLHFPGPLSDKTKQDLGGFRLFVETELDNPEAKREEDATLCKSPVGDIPFFLQDDDGDFFACEDPEKFSFLTYQEGSGRVEMWVCGVGAGVEVKYLCYESREDARLALASAFRGYREYVAWFYGEERDC